jgi:hypothetical protein
MEKTGTGSGTGNIFNNPFDRLSQSQQWSDNVFTDMIPFYQRLADSMNSEISEEWSSAIFEAIFFADGSIYEAEYVRTQDGKVVGFHTASDGPKVFRELRKLFKSQGKKLWGKARFHMSSDGTFDLKFDYDNCDPEGNAIFDEEQELARHIARHRRLSS